MTRSRITLFEPDPTAPAQSQTFAIEYGKQLTITSVGLDSGDTVTFQIVFVPAVDPDNIPAGRVRLPSVAAYSTLKVRGQTVTLSSDNPSIILDTPQRTLLRAVLNTSDPGNIRVWAVESNTSDVSDQLRGLQAN